ncbi:MAG: CoA transferase [Dehalococcoidia bacterium]|jgi:crotonobetainyl-CoA:carnitine CoA-transferase CaiB-like acyl-CoA transferase|nr:CoA transferase [Dehalococcoidia bacterium]
MASGPLDGVRVLEFTQIIAGPLSCQLLADLGADVIKIEPPHGEPWRLNAQFIPLESKTYQGLNRGKQSLAIDLGHPDARDVIYKLLPDIDVVVINYRPDVPAKLGMDYETLRAIKPDLIYADNTAFGREGPWANRPGYDIVVQAASGLMSGLGKLDDRGNPKVGGAYADYTTGYSIALAVSSALFYRAQTGKGQIIETSLLINALHIQGQSMELPAADAAERGQLLADLANREADGVDYATFIQTHERIPQIYYRAYATKDGAIAIGALSAGLRAKVRQALNIEHNRDEPGYSAVDPEQRKIDQAITDQVEEMIRGNTSAYWEQAFEQSGVPVSEVQWVQQLADHPQVAANDYMTTLDHDLSGPQRMAAPPWKMSESPPQAQGAAPPLGRDTDTVLTAAGYSEDELTALRAAGVVR